jgi:predicted TIM-barrel fold metal-dependent hydrolase
MTQEGALAKAVVKKQNGKNLTMIIDCHTHCYPAEIHAAPRQWAQSRGESHWADLVAPVGRRSIQAWATPERMIADMDRAGLSQAVLLGWYWERAQTCRWHNRAIADWVQHAPTRFIGFASIYPNENLSKQLEEAKSLGLRGVGELHPGVQSFDSKSKSWALLADWCSHHHWPINFHCTSDLGNDHPDAIATPLTDYITMAEQHPDLQIILAHWGGGLALNYEGSLPENLYFDCSASPLLYPINVLRKIIDRIGPDKVLFGSDYPLRVLPKAQKQADMSAFIQKIQNEAGLSEAEFAALTSGNALRILKP